MLTRPIFIRPDSELIRKAFLHVRNCLLMEENFGCAKIEWWKNKNIDGFYTKTTQKGGFNKIQQGDEYDK